MIPKRGANMTVENGTTEITGTRTEADQIKDYLESGFYYA